VHSVCGCRVVVQTKNDDDPVTVDSTVLVLHKEGLSRLRMNHPDLAEKFDYMVIRKLSRDLVRTGKLVAVLS